MMLIHVVCWKYRPEVNGDARAEHRQRLAELSQLVPGIERLDVGGDVLHLDRSFDTALVAEFESRDALDTYDAHPAHREVVAIGREIAEKVISVDFDREA